MILNDETKINRFQSDGRTWYWVRDDEYQTQAHRVIQVVEHVCSVVFVLGCMTSCGMGYICKREGKMTQAPYYSILQGGVMKTIE